MGNGCTTKHGALRPRFFGLRLQKRGPRQPKAPFLKNGAQRVDFQPRFSRGALAPLESRVLCACGRVFFGLDLGRVN